MSELPKAWNDWFSRKGWQPGRWAQAAEGVWQVADLPGFFSTSWNLSRQDKLSREPCEIYWIPKETTIEELRRRPWLAVVSSRIGRQFAGKGSWVAALRTALFHAQQQGLGVVTGVGTTTQPFVQRLAGLLRIPLVHLDVMPEQNHGRDGLEAMFQRIEAASISQSPEFTHRVAWCPLPPSRGGDVPQAGVDQAIISEADAVRALAIRPQGNIWRGLQLRLATEPAPDKVWVLCDPSLTKPDVGKSLQESGAVSWLLRGDGEMPADTEFAASHFRTVAELGGLTDFLVHTTRAPRLGRRNAVPLSEIDELLFNSGGNDAGPLAGLIRILADGWIRGGRHLIPGSRPMVSWTEQPLSQLGELRTFRRHLGRWDFEPYGIAVRRERLIELGAKPVVYVEREVLRELSADDLSYAQVKSSRIGNEIVDWTREREWRLADGLRLALLGPADAVIFVPDVSAARRIAPLSRWPVVLLDKGHGTGP